MSTENSSVRVLIYIQRLKSYFGVKRDDELADKIGLSKQAISNWRTRNKVPLKFQQEMLDTRGIAYADWDYTHLPEISDISYSIGIYCCYKFLSERGKLSDVSWRSLGQVFPKIFRAVEARLGQNPALLANTNSAIELLQGYFDSGRFIEINEALEEVLNQE